MGKSKSKTKSRFMKPETIIEDYEQKSEKASPFPKSPGVHMKSPGSKSKLMKIKTSIKLKISSEKLMSTATAKSPRNDKKKK